MDSAFIKWENSENSLRVNPRWPEEIKAFFKNAIASAIQKYQIQSSIFLPTSGTTAVDLRDIKIVWLKKQAFLSAADSVGKYFHFSNRDKVAVTLPPFHVGGLSQEARQFVWGQKPSYFQGAWNAKSFFEFLTVNEITHTSLVPTQVFDLVQAGFQAPSYLKCIFIGGGALGEELRKRAEALGWKLEITYGMTETAALVAVSKGEGFQALPHAQFALSQDGFLKIKSSSLFSGYFKRYDKDLILETNSLKDGWFTTEDFAEETSGRFHILGRQQDYAKISGEGVYLGRLQILLQDSWLQAGLTSFGSGVLRFASSERLGSEIHLVSTLPEADIQTALKIFHHKVLPFERIRAFHQVKDIPKTDLGKIRLKDIKE